MFLGCFGNLEAQDPNDLDSLFHQFLRFYNKGEYFEAKKCIIPLVQLDTSEMPVDPWVIYNDAGLICARLGQPNRALWYYDMAEKYCILPEEDPYPLISNYNHRANLYHSLNDLRKASLYFDAAINLLSEYGTKSPKYLNTLSMLQLNYGNLLYEFKKYDEARNYLNKSLKIKRSLNHSYIFSVYLNLARISDREGKFDAAEHYYVLAIAEATKEVGEGQKQLAGIYVEYGEMLTMTDRYGRAERYIDRAIDIYIQKYGFHHPATAAAYQICGDLYFAQNKYLRALEMYQTALRSLYIDFDARDIHKNPGREGSLHETRAITILYHKTRALNGMADSTASPEGKQKFLGSALEAINTAISIKDEISMRYASGESRLILANEEKGIYMAGIRAALKLYELTGEEGFLNKAYLMGSEWKAYELNRKLNTREYVHRLAGSDTLLRALLEADEEISSFNRMVNTEKSKMDRDTASLDVWENKLFHLNLRMDSLHALAKAKPWYSRLYPTTRTPGIREIQDKLGRQQTLIEYALPAEDGEEKDFYIFIIDRKNMHYAEVSLDPSFRDDVRFCRQYMDHFSLYSVTPETNDSLAMALHRFYLRFFRPVEKYAEHKEILVIPDGAVNYIPLESCITAISPGEKLNFAGLPYLIYRYEFSYLYSSGMLFSDGKAPSKDEKVISFTPFATDDARAEIQTLAGSGEESGMLMDLFGGTWFRNEKATVQSFLTSGSGDVIFHFAMHAQNEEENAEGNYLLFSGKGKLFDYEISSLDLHSPLVILNACNTGTGNLNNGEGMLCLTRSFMAAGAGSVVHTLWVADDGSSPLMMNRFYRKLAAGKPKNTALREAKLEYLDKAPPFLTNPYFWSGYQLVGNTSPVRSKPWLLLAAEILAAVLMIFLAVRTGSNLDPHSSSF